MITRLELGELTLGLLERLSWLSGYGAIVVSAFFPWAKSSLSFYHHSYIRGA